MKALAWYTGVTVVLSNVVMTANILTRAEIVMSLWGFVLNIPIILFAVLYLINLHKKQNNI